MPTTSPDSIYYADGTTPASLSNITAAMATSIQNALNVREQKNYVWADTTAQSAQTGMAVGDIGYKVDDDVYYIYSGSAWRIWAKQPTAYTPTITGLSTSSRSFIYSISGGVVNVSGYGVSSGVATAAIVISLPSTFNVNAALLPTSNAVIIGTGGMDDASTTNNYSLGVRVITNATVGLTAYNAASTNLLVVDTSASIPVAWASGDVFNVNFSYPVA
jgi:hypothetical protein